MPVYTRNTDKLYNVVVFNVLPTHIDTYVIGIEPSGEAHTFMSEGTPSQMEEMETYLLEEGYVKSPVSAGAVLRQIGAI